MRSMFAPLLSLAAAGSVLLTGASAIAQAADATAKKMNVLFIVADDLRPELGCYGKTQVVSPNIDKLAERGFLFERAYCPQALCAPSRASVLTGCWPDTTGVHGLQPPLAKSRPDLVTLPRAFKEAGYQTISLGKVYHHGQAEDPDGWSEKPWGPKGNWLGRGIAGTKARELYQQEMDQAQDKSRVIGPAVDRADVPDNGLPDGVIAEKAIAELNRLKDEPFFLAVGFAKPHLPFAAPTKYWDLYERDALKISDVAQWPKEMPWFAGMNSGELRQYWGIPKEDVRLADEQALELIHGYLASVSYMDAQVGRVLDELDRLGLRDNTVVMLWGDHGYKLSEYSAWCKHTNFEIDTRSPLIVRAPGYQGGQKLNQLVDFVDMYPTLTELCGVSTPDSVEGTSFVPLLKEPQRQWKSAAFSQYPRLGAHESGSMGYTMRTDRYRFTEWVKDGQVIARELYDHKDTELDLVNIVDRPENAELVKQLSEQRQAGWRAARPKR